MRRISLLAACLTASATMLAQTPVRQMTVTPTTGEAQTFIVSDIDEITFATAGEYHVVATANDAERGSVKSGYYEAVDEIATFYATPKEGYRLSHWTIGETIVVQKDLKVRVTEDFNDLEIQAVFVEDTKHNGHSYVDILGDGSVLWATCNVGATNPEDYGDYFAWGEVEPKSYYDWSTYKYTTDGGASFAKYTDNESATLEPTDDAAKYTWGAEWRMPTHEEQVALFDVNSENWTWQTADSELGLQGGFIIENNDVVLFLPAAGCRDASNLIADKTKGYYLSTSLNTSKNTTAFSASFDDGEPSIDYAAYRFIGRSVRPVVTKSDIID